ncbi:hypothetical protein [Mucilaginibacter mallensis]|nr:hypothetical protein [Mucilaginibacter mallensis]
MALTTRAAQRWRECRFSFLGDVRHEGAEQRKKREEPAGSAEASLLS